MPQKTIATLSTPLVDTQFSYRFLDPKVEDKRLVVLAGSLDFMGAELGEVLDDGKAELPSLPQYALPPGTPDGSPLAQDTRRANGVLYIQPRKTLEALRTARSFTIRAYRQIHVLTDEGYTGNARLNALGRWIEEERPALVNAAADVWAAHERAQTELNHARSSFPKTAETELQEVMFDTAILTRLGELAPTEKAALRDGYLPPRLSDARTIAAIFRAPPAVHGLDDESLAHLKDCFGAAAWPRLFEAATILEKLAESARVAVASALVTISYLRHIPPDAAFSIVANPEYFLEIRHETLGGVSRERMLKRESIARHDAGDFSDVQ